MRHVLISLVAALACGATLAAAAAPSFAGDHDGDDWGDGAYTEVHRDGNVFYNAYNSSDGYYRHSYGSYWERPYDNGGGYAYGGCGSCGGYSYGEGGYDGYGARARYGRRDHHVYFPGYGYADLSRRDEHRRAEHARRRAEHHDY